MALLKKFENYIKGMGNIFNIAGTPYKVQDQQKRVSENMTKAWGRIGYAMTKSMNTLEQEYNAKSKEL